MNPFQRALECAAPAPSAMAVRDRFLDVMRRFPATVTVVTSGLPEGEHGMTVTAVTSVSMEPPALAICLNSTSWLHEILLKQPEFAVNVLAAGQQEVASAFAGKVPPAERFQHPDWTHHTTGVRVLQGAHARIVCRRVAAVPFGTHTLFIGQVLDATHNEGTEPLLYENARYCVSRPAA